MQVKIKTKFIKLSALLKLAGLCQTGGEAKLAITLDYVKVNGEVCPIRGKKIVAGDVVEYKGDVIEVTQE